MWTQNLTLTIDAVTAALQGTQNLLQETHDQTPQMLLAECSLAELSLVKPSLAELSLAELSLAKLNLAELSLAKLSCDQLTEYD